jgi:cellulose synthase/poly-beta-1,6-N-acetylglucosamine synthase-like glycosyltransferase
VHTDKPLVSAIIPTYNYGQYLSRALDSILAQEGRGEQFEIEIIVVDDASTDATSEVVQRYPQARYLRLPHRQGVSAARNAGIRASTGRYIAFLDADDTWLPCKLRVQVPLLLSHPEVGVVYSQSIRREAEEERLFPEASRAPSGRVFEAMLAYNFAVRCAALLVRREAFDTAGYFDETLVTSEDNDMSLRLAFHFRFLFEPVPVTIYNISPNGSWLTRAASGGATDDYRRVMEKALQMLPDSRRYKRIREETPIRVAMQTISPWVLVGELTRARAKLLEALREYPLSGRHAWVRYRVRWVTHQLLLKAASPLAEARELCTEIESATGGAGGLRGRRYTRWILAEIWADVFLSDALRRRVGRRSAAYAAARAISYAPANVGLAYRMGRALLKR